MSNLNLKENPTLKDLQEYVAQLSKERGFDKGPSSETFMLLLEECGEMAKAARKTHGPKLDKNSEKFHIDEEAADVLLILLDLCNRFEINLEEAFRKKEEKNKKRIWG